MAVGTNIGNTYRGQQGTGFATTIDYDPSVDIALAKMGQDAGAAKAEAEAAKQKKISDAHAQLLKDKPDYWHIHDKELMGVQNGALDMGAAIIASGNDPYTSMDDDSVNFRKLRDRMLTYSDASLQYRKEWGDIQKAYKTREQRDEIENWDEIALFYANPSIIDRVENGETPPLPKFKKPEVSTHKLAAERVKSRRDLDKGFVYSMNDAIDEARQMLSDPTMSEGFASDGSKFKQRYDELVNMLPEGEKDKFNAKAGRTGAKSGYEQYVADYIYSFTDPVTTFEEEFLKMAKTVEKSFSKIEDGNVTKSSKYSKLSDKELRNVVKAKLMTNEGIVERDVTAGKYGDPDKLVDKNLKAAEDYYFPIFKKNIATSFEKTEDEAGKAGKKAEQSRNDWYNAVTGKLGRKAQEEAAAQLQNLNYLGGEVIQALPSLDGETITMMRKGDDGGVMEEVVLPLIGPKESVTALYDESLRSGRKPFEKKEDGFDFGADEGFEFDN